MEIKPIRGGKRDGSGRKPLSNPKKQVSLYIEKNKFYKFGGEEKMKDKIYDFIDNFESESGQPKVFDAPKIQKDNFIDEPKQWEEVIKDYSYYEKLGQQVEFDDAEKLIKEILSSNLKSWQKPMLQKMINERFFEP